jgi:C4-dicarboxylate-specific signal transduction histidine kinase
VLFSDSGPGVREDIQDRIYEPYFSTKEDGVGLGLSIAGEIVKDYYDGDLALLDSGPLPGANFLITLRRRV